ncbi:MAG: hypothetical protein KIT85_07710 [Pseudolabrys sp.]|nr:hypothetical protein [Pseudolabrys sp.]
MPLAPPPRDGKGNVTPHDAPDIQPDDGIIRRVSNNQLITDAKGRRRLSSIAFQASSSGEHPGLSIDLERQIVEDGLDARKFVTTPRWIGSVRLVAKEVRALGFQIGSDPIIGHPSLPDNPYHGEVWGIKSKSDQKALQDLSQWFVAIPNAFTV